MVRANRICIVLLLAALAAAPLWADGSLFGTIAGKTRDESGGALPGVTVTLTSEQKGVQRTETTDASGSFTFALLPPGTYTVKATLSGFDPIEAANNVVQAEKTTTVPLNMRLAKAEAEILVRGDAPLVDRTNTSDTTRVESTLTDVLPIARGYQTVIELAPGVNDADADGNTNSHGAIDASNLYLFDGVDTTDPTTGTFGANNNFDTIQEVVVSNANISAEYGRAQGAIVNVITKSGTNIFHGSGRALVTNDSWDPQNKGGESFEREKLDREVYDYLFTLGGPVVKDHAWFFGAYERNPQFTPPAQVAISELNPPPLSGQSYSANRVFEAWQGKLNGQITPSHALTFSAQADPFTGIIRNYWAEFGLPSAELQALTLQSQSDDCPWACIWQTRYTGVFGQNLSVEATYAQQRGGLTVTNYQGDGSPIFNLAEGLFYNGNPFEGSVQRPRDQANLALTMYSELFGHSHTFKAGVDYQKIESRSSFTYPGNQSFYISGFDAGTRTMLLQPGDQWFQGTPPEASVSNGKIWGIYGLDRFDVTNRLSMNLGVRVDVQNGESDLQQAVVSATTVSPRLSASYDLFGDGKTLASMGYGVYRDFLVQNIIDTIYSGVPQEVNFDLYTWDGSQWQFTQAIRAGGNDAPVNEDLTPSKVDEFNVAIQHQIGNTASVGLRGIYRKWTNLIDDARRITDEGEKLQTPLNFTGGQLKRQYKAIEFTFEKRFSSQWQVLASYTLSRADGNHESIFSSQLFDYNGTTCTVPAVTDSEGNVIAPEVSGNCPDILAHNRSGLLSYDVTSLGKLYAAYTMPFSWVNLTAAPSFTFSSGLPYQAQQVFNINGDADVYYYTRKGSSRLPNWYTVNFALQADFKILGPVQLGVKGEIQNLTNQQPVVATGGITLLPNENFGEPTSRSAQLAPRHFQFSAFVRF